MSGYMVLVDFHLKRGGLETFRELIDMNARQSAQPGCRRFDVIEPHGAADAILLYEIYSDRTDFDAHMRSEHYARFDAAKRRTRREQVGSLWRTSLRGLYLAKPTITRETRTVKEPADYRRER